MTMTMAAPTVPDVAPDRVRPWLRRVRYEADATEDAAWEPPPPHPVVTAADPDDPAPVRAALAGLVRLAMEVFDGRRPTAHLARHFDAPALRYWRAATAQRRGVSAPTRVERLVLCLPRADAAEVAAVCTVDGRVRALAARFERSSAGDGWRCTAVRLG